MDDLIFLLPKILNATRILLCRDRREHTGIKRIDTYLAFKRTDKLKQEIGKPPTSHRMIRNLPPSL